MVEGDSDSYYFQKKFIYAEIHSNNDQKTADIFLAKTTFEIKIE